MSREDPVAKRVHARAAFPHRAYCGTVSPALVTVDRGLVTCVNCQAAIRADEEAN